jgi:hypothetical protein
MPTPDLASAIKLLAVPEIWPPLAADQATQAYPGSSAGPLTADPAQAPARAAAREAGPPWPRQFAVLLAEGLAGVRPIRQVLPWMSEQGSLHLHRLLPLFAGGHRPRLQRVITAQPAKDVIEMTMIVAFGPRTRALAVRLEQTAPAQTPRWRCTAIEAA